MRAKSLLFMTLAAIGANACGKNSAGLPGNAKVDTAAQRPPANDFSVLVIPTHLDMAAGAVAAAAVDLDRGSGLAAPITVRVDRAPAGISATLVSVGPDHYTLDIVADAAAPAGTAPIVLVAAGAGLSHTATLELTISLAPPPVPQGGRLAVDIAAPPGATAVVKVSGPGGFAHELSRSATLDGLAPGAYQVDAPALDAPGALVSTRYDSAITGNPANIAAGGTGTITVAYAPRPATGFLWVTDVATSTLWGYDAAALTATGTPTPAINIGLGDHPAPFAVVADGDNAVWVAKALQHRVDRYDATQLATSGVKNPAASISLPAGPVSLHLDGAGSLWVLANDFVLRRFDHAREGGVLGAEDAAFALGGVRADSMTFNAQGDLLVVGVLTNELGIFRHAKLTAGGAITADAVITSAALSAPQKIAVDPEGGVWIANYAGGAGALVRYDPSQLAVSGAQKIDPALTVTSAAFAVPAGITFDLTGDLWIADYGRRTAARFAKAQLNASGIAALSPAVVITGDPSGAAASSFSDLTFNPKNPSLP